MAMVFFWTGNNPTVMSAAETALAEVGLAVRAKHANSIEVEGGIDELSAAMGLTIPNQTGEIPVPSFLRSLCRWARVLLNGEYIADENLRVA